MGNFYVVKTDGDLRSTKIERRIIEEAGGTLAEFECTTSEEIINAAREADALLVLAAPITAQVIRELKKCSIIARYGIGVDMIDLEEATKKGIYVANVPDYCIDEVSFHTLAFILNLSRQISTLDRAVRKGIWNTLEVITPGLRLNGQILGIIGFGRIGREVARKATCLGLRVIVYDPYLEVNQVEGVKLVSLEELLREADYISLHLPLNKNTRHFLNKSLLGQMKTSAYVINNSRGALINESDLIKALQNNQIAGAALDVLETEPPQSDNPLLGMENVLLTSHAAWSSATAQESVQSAVAEEIVRVMRGGIPKNLVNPEVLKRR